MLNLIANENRFAIIYHLIEKPMDVSNLHKRLYNISQSALVQELGILKMNKVIDSYKSEETITYFIVDKRLIDVVETIKVGYLD